MEMEGNGKPEKKLERIVAAREDWLE